MQKVPLATAAMTLTAVLFAASAAAQETGAVGVTLGYPAFVGIVWEATSRVAVRPKVAFSGSHFRDLISSTITIGSTATTTVTSTATSDTASIATEIGVLLGLKRWDTVQVYAAPSYGYSRGKTTSVTTTAGLSGTQNTSTRETIVVGHAFGGALGAQFTPHEHFGVFGEWGLRFVTQRSTSFDQKGHSFGSVGSGGVILYF